MLKTHSGKIVGDSGPVQRIIRRGEIPGVTGYCIDYVYTLIKAGKFPKPLRLGANAVGWLESDIAKWQGERITERDGEELAR